MNELQTVEQQGGELVPASFGTVGGSFFFDPVRFEHAQRVAKMLMTSDMVPDHFRGNIGNCVIALNYAERIGADPFMCMQNMCVIHGKPGIEGKLVIALVNNCGRFDPIQFEEIGDLKNPADDSDGVVAYAKDKASGIVLKGPVVDWNMVKKEGWLAKKGSKWQTMAPLMFRYRSATYFARTYCPEVLLGMQTREELNDIVDLTPSRNGVYSKPNGHAADPPGTVIAKNTEYEIKQAPKVKAPPKQEAPAEDPEPPREPPSDPQTLADITDPKQHPLWSECVRLKKAGFSTWVYKNKERLAEAFEQMPAFRGLISTKWAGMYPDPFPFANPESGTDAPSDGPGNEDEDEKQGPPETEETNEEASQGDGPAPMSELQITNLADYKSKYPAAYADALQLLGHKPATSADADYLIDEIDQILDFERVPDADNGQRF